MNEERAKNQWNSSIVNHILAVTGLILCFLSCDERDAQDKNSYKQIGTPVALHQTVISDLPANSKPPKILLDRVPKPKSQRLSGGGAKNIDNKRGDRLKKSTAQITHLFIDTLTGLPIPEGAQGRGLFTTYTTDEGLALDQILCSYKDKNGNL